MSESATDHTFRDKLHRNQWLLLPTGWLILPLVLLGALLLDQVHPPGFVHQLYRKLIFLSAISGLVVSAGTPLLNRGNIALRVMYAFLSLMVFVLLAWGSLYWVVQHIHLDWR